MGNYSYGKVVQDFASRTKKNLAFIEDNLNKPDVEVYEVTQLVNSLLGLLVFPQQEFFEKIPEIPMRDLEAQGWPRIHTVPQYKSLGDLKTFLRYFRNGISHFNIKFSADDDNNITGLQIWNHKGGKKQNPKNWEIELSLNDLKIITEKFLELIEKEIK
jgi:hypothetical protein